MIIIHWNNTIRTCSIFLSHPQWHQKWKTINPKTFFKSYYVFLSYVDWCHWIITFFFGFKFWYFRSNQYDKIINNRNILAAFGIDQKKKKQVCMNEIVLSFIRTHHWPHFVMCHSNYSILFSLYSNILYLPTITSFMFNIFAISTIFIWHN